MHSRTLKFLETWATIVSSSNHRYLFFGDHLKTHTVIALLYNTMRWCIANAICQCKASALWFASVRFIVMSLIAWQSWFQTEHVCTICCILCSVPPPFPLFLLCEMQWVVMLVLYSLFHDAVKRKHICSTKLSFFCPINIISSLKASLWVLFSFANT